MDAQQIYHFFNKFPRLKCVWKIPVFGAEIVAKSECTVFRYIRFSLFIAKAQQSAAQCC